MNKKPLDFSKTVIYKICCKDPLITDCYIGKTTNLQNRKQAHKAACIKQSDFKVYQYINANGGWSNWEMIEVEKCKCTNKEEATKKEREWYDKLKPALNNNIPDQRKDMWQRNNKQKMAQYARNYYHSRTQKDPEYKKMLCEKQKSNTLKRHNQTIVKPQGRPLKYPIEEYQFDPVSESLLKLV
jgi:hypothetical protein